MKTRETKKQKNPVVILSEVTDGVNKVRLLRAARAEEEEACPWEEIDAYSGRFVVAGWRYDTGDTSNNYHPWLAYSTDGGKTWTKSDTTANEEQPHGELYALAYGGGRFVVAGHQTNTSTGDTSTNLHPWLAYSTDGGKTWTPSDTTADESQPHGHLCALAYGGGRFVVAGYRYTVSNSDDPDPSDNLHPWLAYSTDGGKTWTPSDTTANEEQPHGYLYALAYGGGRFVVAGWRYDNSDDTSDTSDNYHPWLAYSTDGGKTWTPSETTGDVNQAHGQLCALAYGGGRFVVAGWQYSDSGDTAAHSWLAYSTDGGKTWTPSDTTADESQPRGYLYALAYGGGRFVVAGRRYADSMSTAFHPLLAYSTDGGETWTKNETTTDANQLHGYLYALAYGGGRFVAAGYRYYDTDDTDDNNNESENYHPWLAYSTDGGKTWTRNETTTAENQPHGELRALTYAPDTYCWKFGKETDEEDEEEEEEEGE